MPWPVAGGRPERTDQGVDEGVTPGKTVTDPVPGTSSLVGVISNWYNGQPFYWFKVLTGKFKGQYWYVAEQVRSNLKRGQKVSQGQGIGTVPSSGTGIESGWATASGQTRARATTGYTEGQVTPAGQQWRQQIIDASGGGGGGGSGISRPGGQPAGQNTQGVTDLFAAYEAEMNAPRTAPQGFVSLSSAGIAAPFVWWWQSFAARYNADINVAPVQTPGSPSSKTPGRGGTKSVPQTPSGGYSQKTWAQALLRALGMPVTSNNIGNIMAWETQEGGNWNNSAKYNPLNTTQTAPGSYNPGFSAGVQAYTSWAEGLQATVQTLTNGSYSGILAVLRRSGSLSEFKAAVNSSPWGTVF